VTDWNTDQAIGERAMREHAVKREAAMRLADALLTSGISIDDCRSVEMLYAVAGQAGSHRIVEAMRYLQAWLRGVK
jgi:hypothetical protein